MDEFWLGYCAGVGTVIVVSLAIFALVVRFGRELTEKHSEKEAQDATCERTAVEEITAT